jgi:hypothetical protein
MNTNFICPAGRYFIVDPMLVFTTWEYYCSDVTDQLEHTHLLRDYRGIVTAADKERVLGHWYDALRQLEQSHHAIVEVNGEIIEVWAARGKVAIRERHTSYANGNLLCVNLTKTGIDRFDNVFVYSGWIGTTKYRPMKASRDVLSGYRYAEPFAIEFDEDTGTFKLGTDMEIQTDPEIFYPLRRGL